ncbi:MAG: response regulator [Lachnospiraceae bacterium]|nr:response regulator [Lachnospiraceae bacterium]MBR5356616.1 response regulator [Lachnospiraceae bacterium]
MQLRVAVVGKSKIIVGDVSNRVYRGDYFVCPVFFNEPEALAKIERLYPHVIIICLNDEGFEEYEEYNRLLEYKKIGEAAIIVIAHPDKYSKFTQVTGLKVSSFVKRPLRLEDLFGALDKIKDDISVADEQVFKEKIKDLQSVVERQKFEAYKKQRALAAAAKEIKKEVTITPREDTGGFVPTKKEKKTVLVVDTDTLILSNLKDFLEDKYIVVCVPNAPLAMKYLEKYRPDVIVLDYTINLYGRSLPKNKKEIEDIPKVVLCASTDKAVIKQVLMGIRPRGFIKKPVDREALLEKLNEIFENFT